ncbi:MAG: DEAD/DEAH box helicase family protein [Lachnospiraceae bacterium]
MEKFNILVKNGKESGMHDYQKKAIEALELLDKKYPEFYRTLVVIPTGGGKTRTAIKYVYKNVLNKKGGKVLWICERLLLQEQSYNSFRSMATNANLGNRNVSKIIAGVYSGEAGDFTKENLKDAELVFVTQQTLNISLSGNNSKANPLNDWISSEDSLTVIIDEAHHATSKNYKNILRALEDLKESKNIRLHIIGLTATPKLKETRLATDIERIFTHGVENNTASTNTCYACRVSIHELVANGFLSKPYLVRINDTYEGESNKRMNEVIVSAYLSKLKDKPVECGDTSEGNEDSLPIDELGKTVIFVNSRVQAILLKNEFEAVGLKEKCGLAISIDKTLWQQKELQGIIPITDKDVSKDIEDFKHGTKTILISVDMLLEGIDIPTIQTVFLARKTENSKLITQMVGRGLRGLKVGGTEVAYLVDFGNNKLDKILWETPDASKNNAFDLIGGYEITGTDFGGLGGGGGRGTLSDDEKFDMLRDAMMQPYFLKDKKTMERWLQAKGMENFMEVGQIPYGYFCICGMPLLAWDKTKDWVEKIYTAAKTDHITDTRLKESLESFLVFRRRRRSVLKNFTGLEGLYDVIKKSHKELQEIFLRYVYYTLYNIYVVNKKVIPSEFKCTQFQTNIATDMKKVLIGAVDCDESELEDYLEKEWKNYPDKNFWRSDDVFKHYVRKQIEEYKNIPELSDSGYQIVRIYRNGKKRQNLIDMVQTISREYISTQDNPEEIDFFDVFGGTGIVTANMSEVIEGKRYYNEFDVGVANFFDCLNRFEHIGRDFTKYLAKLESGLSMQVIGTQMELEKDLEVMKNFELSTTPDYHKEAEEYLNKKKEKLSETSEFLKLLIRLLKDKDVEEYVKLYIAYYRQFKKDLETIKKEKETTWKSIYHERFEAEFNNGARPKGHSECIDKMKTAAFYFYYINSFASRAVSNSDITGVDPYGIAQLKKSISEYGVTWISELHKRVKDVKIFSEDFAKILNEINKPNAIYYLDPPYFLTKQFDDGFPDEFHLKMLKWFRETDCKWILSCKSCPTNTQSKKDMEERVGNKNTSGEEGTTLIRYRGNTTEKYESKWLEHDKEDLTMQEYFRLFLYEPLYMDPDEDAKKWGADKSVIADTTSEKKNEGKLFVYHGKKPDKEYAEIMVSNIKVPDEHQYILENSGIIMEPFEEFFRPLLED